MTKEEFLDTFALNIKVNIKAFLNNAKDGQMLAYAKELQEKNANNTAECNKKLGEISNNIKIINAKIAYDYTDNAQASREEFDRRKELIRGLNSFADELYNTLFPAVPEKNAVQKLASAVKSKLHVKKDKTVTDAARVTEAMQLESNQSRINAFVVALFNRESIFLLGTEPTSD